ncbi:AbgT family transporter [Vibrio sp. M60_M31a]
MFNTVGRNPIAGIVAAFIFTFAGFSANFFIAGTDMAIFWHFNRSGSKCTPWAMK